MGNPKVALHEEVKCPSCGHKLNAAAAASPEPDHDAPRESDLTICFYCHSVLIYGGTGTPRLPTQEELDGMSSDQKAVLDYVVKELRKACNVS